MCDEAGYEGLLAGPLAGAGVAIETVILDPASLLVNRKAKQRKTDRIDAKKMVRALLAYERGDAAVLSRVPSIEEEDRRRLLRERQRLVKERTALTNAIKGLLKLHGIVDLEPRAAAFAATFAAATTACGAPGDRADRRTAGLGHAAGQGDRGRARRGRMPHAERMRRDRP